MRLVSGLLGPGALTGTGDSDPRPANASRCMVGRATLGGRRRHRGRHKRGVTGPGHNNRTVEPLMDRDDPPAPTPAEVKELDRPATTHDSASILWACM